MKQFILLTAILVILLSCKKSNNTSTGNSNNNSNNTPSMTALESSLVGKWYWSKMVPYSNSLPNNIDSAIFAQVYANTYVDLQSSVSSFQNATPGLIYHVTVYTDTYYSGTSTANAWWGVAPPNSYGNNTSQAYLSASSVPNIAGYIESITSTTLVVASWPPGSPPDNGTEYYFHK